MIENIQQYWYLYVLLVVLIIITAFVWKKAVGAASKHSKVINEQIAKAKRSKELLEAYKDLTAAVIEKAPANTLFEGVALSLEAQCQKSEDSNSFYAQLNEAQKSVYAFYYLASDAKEQSLSAFFKASARPLTSDAVNAAEKILPENIFNTVKAMFDCYDEENENASVIPETVEKLNFEFSEASADLDFYALGGEFIKHNSSAFINDTQS